MKTVHESGKERRLLQRASRIRQSESDRADRWEYSLLSSSTTNQWNSRHQIYETDGKSIFKSSNDKIRRNNSTYLREYFLVIKRSD